MPKVSAKDSVRDDDAIVIVSGRACCFLLMSGRTHGPGLLGLPHLDPSSGVTASLAGVLQLGS